MQRYVDVEFSCLPLRSVGRRDIPLDASPQFRALCERILAAIDKHGAYHTYYLYNAGCTFHLTNDDRQGMLRFAYEGTVLTDSEDQHCKTTDLDVQLESETCEWLTEPVVAWFFKTVCEAVRVEFDRYIASGDLEQAKQRAARIQSASDNAGGFLGMYL
jgi:hypothetical protein